LGETAGNLFPGPGIPGVRDERVPKNMSLLIFIPAPSYTVPDIGKDGSSLLENDRRGFSWNVFINAGYKIRGGLKKSKILLFPSSRVAPERC
jgi:hypothetical protein